MALNAKSIILYDNRFDDGLPAATDTASGYDVLNIRDWRTYTFWRAASFGTKYITVDCGTAKSADALGLISHNLGAAAATVSVESSATGAWAGEQVERLAGFVPSNDLAIFKAFTSASARYWRIKIVTASVAAQIAIVILGARLTMEKYVQGEFAPDPEKIEGESTRSRGAGHLLGSVVRHHSRNIKASFRNITPSWFSATFKPAWDAHISLFKPFFWIWDMTNHADQIYLVKAPDGFELSAAYDPTRRSLSLEFEGVKE